MELHAPAPLLAESDVLVVGAGILGLAHAFAALDRGLTVTLIERDSRAIGASVRNFGHACVTAQTGELLELALLARERWLRHGSAAGISAVEAGALAVARSAAERAVLEELAATRAREDAEQVRLLTPAQVREHLGDDADPAIVGGALLRDDLRVDPRAAVAGLAAHLERQPSTRVLWRTAYLGQDDDGTARTTRGRIRAARTIVCAGHDLDHVFPELAEEFEVERCALQMTLVDPPTGLRIRPAVLTGTSMLRYPAFAETDAATTLRAEMQRLHPELIDIVANVMFTQRPDGGLIVGDSHRYAVTQDPFQDEPVTRTLLQEVATILGTERLRVRQRWQGIYASSGKQAYVIAHPSDSVTSVTITSGVGMTISLGVAERTFAQLA